MSRKPRWMRLPMLDAALLWPPMSHPHLFSSAPVHRCLRVVALCLVTIGCVSFYRVHRERERAAASSESRKLTEIVERHFEAYLELFPPFATWIGDHATMTV